MKTIKSIICCFLFLVLFVNSSQSNSEDYSLTEKEYIKLGIPEDIKELSDYAKVYNTLWDLVMKDKKTLLKYNSIKSGKFFLKLFNKSIIDKIKLLNISILEKRQLLGKYSLMLSDFAGLYLQNNPNEMYVNEVKRISSIGTYTTICIYELMDEELSENNASLPDDKLLFLTKMIGRDMWSIEYEIQKLKKTDKPTYETLKNDYESYKKKLSSIKFLNYDENISKIGSLY